jgi:hypothetical protein
MAPRYLLGIVGGLAFLGWLLLPVMTQRWPEPEPITMQCVAGCSLDPAQFLVQCMGCSGVGLDWLTKSHSNAAPVGGVP